MGGIQRIKLVPKLLNTHLPAIFLTLGLLLASSWLYAQVDTSVNAATDAATGAKAGANAKVALPDNVPDLLVMANQAYADKDYSTFLNAMQKIHEKRPNNGEYMYQLVIAHALMKQKTPAYDMMLRMQQQGLAYDFNQTESTLYIRDTEVYEFVNDMMKTAGEPMGTSELVVTLPADVLMPETIAWDEDRQKFLLGTISDGSIFAVGKDGQIDRLLSADDENGMWAILDIQVDQARNKLWVTSSAIPAFTAYDAVDKGRSALFEYNLKTLELIHRYPVPVDGKPHSLGSMTLGPDGGVFIADRILPIIYSKPAGGKKLQAIAASRQMVSMRGVAMQPDGSVFYVADREMGIEIFDFKNNRSGKLHVPDSLNLGGIDGLYLWDNHLIVIQNGIKPQRIMRLQLDDSGTRVEAVRPLAVAQEEFDYPSYGEIVGGDIYYFANSHWGDSKDKMKPVTILKTPLDSSADLQMPDIGKLLKQRSDKLDAQRQKTSNN